MTVDCYGRPASGFVSAVLSRADAGTLIPPMPATKRSGKWPAFLHTFLVGNPTCLGCGRKAQTAHHVEPFGLFPERELDVTNLVPVCVPCHFVLCHLGDWNVYLPSAKAALNKHRTQMREARPIIKGVK